jgi:hypothetical protein
MDFKIGKGPWQTIFSGVFQDHEMEILENPESLLMVAIYEKEGAIKTGVLLECFKAYQAEGNIEALIDKTKTPSMVFLKHNGIDTLKFFLLGGQPAYAAHEEDEVHKETDSLINTVITNSRIVKGMALASDISLTPLSKADEEIRKAFFSQPLALVTVSGAAGRTGTPHKLPEHTSHTHDKHMEQITIESRPTSGSVVLGVDNQNKPIKEPMALFEKTLIESGKPEERTHTLRVLIESALLSQATTIIFDTQNMFQGLGNPTTDSKKLKEFGVPFDPVGFPLRTVTVPEGFHVDIGTITAQHLAELFGFDQPTQNALEGLLAGNATSFSEKIRMGEQQAVGSDESEFIRQRGIRILRVLDSKYPGLFGGSNTVSDFLSGGVGGLGRAVIIDCAQKDQATLSLIAQSVLKEIFDAVQKKGKTKKLGAMIVFPHAEILFPPHTESVLMQDHIELLWKLKDYGVGFVIGTEKATSLNENLRKLPEARLSVISGIDVGVQLKGKRNYRVKIRPTLSKE